MDFYRNFMAALEIPEEVQQRVYYGNAVQWLGARRGALRAPDCLVTI